MFVIKYDKVSMIRLIQCIEKYPAIFNTKKHYSKEDVETAWMEIALEVGEKDSLCRERWHSIKSCYIRHLKYSALNSRRRPYYLAEFLEFLKPFVYERIRTALLSKKYELNNLPTYLKDALPAETTPSYLAQSVYSESNYEIKTEIIDVETDDCSEYPNFTFENQQPSSSKVTSKENSTSNTCKKNKALREKPPVSKDEDVIFFKSVLPDISRMSSHQKLKFKQETLSIIEDILYASDEINGCS